MLPSSAKITFFALFVWLSELILTGCSCQYFGNDRNNQKEEEVGKSPAIPSPPSYIKIADLAYSHIGSRSLKLDLYLPQKQTEPTPLIIWFFGGGWQSGNKSFTIATRMIERGYAVASVEYRLSDEAHYPAQIHDCKAAVRWLRANSKKYGLDAEKFGAWGVSSGAHLATLLGTTDAKDGLEGDGGNPEFSSRVQAVCDYYGPTDFFRLTKEGDPSEYIGLLEMMEKLIGGPLEENRALVRKANPITFITSDDPPFLIVHGDRDRTVPIYQSEILYAALRKSGVKARFHIERGARHGVTFFKSQSLDNIVNEFFDSYLRAKREFPDTSSSQNGK